MPYSADTFVADEQPTTAKWNKLWSNDASFNDGSGLGDNTITHERLNSSVAFLARRTTDQTGIVTATATKVQYATEDMDRGSDYDNATNYRFTAPYNGDYHLSAGVHIDAPGTGGQSIDLRKNGTTSLSFKFDYSPAASNDNSSVVSNTVPLAAGDYVEVFATHNAGANRTFIGSLVGGCFFSGFLVGRY